MRKLLWLLPCLLLSGCFWVVDDSRRPGDGAYYPDRLWFEDTWVSCNYDYHSGYSDWYFFAQVDSAYGYEDIYAVDVVINELSYDDTDITLSLYRRGYGEWDTTFTSWYYDCNYWYEFRFIAYDFDGYSMDTWVGW